MKNSFPLLIFIILTGCATSEVRYQHSGQAVQTLFNEKTKNYNEKQDGLIYGVNLNEPGPQGLIFDKVSSETGAKIYSRWEYTSDGKVRTNIQLDKSGRIIQLDRYWFGFPRADMDAILAAQKQLFEANYAIKLRSMTEMGERGFLNKDEFFHELQSKSMECNNRCMRLTQNDKGISKTIIVAGYNYFWLNGDPNRFVQVELLTRNLIEYNSKKINKYK